MAPEVLDAMLPYMTERFGNPSSFHSFGSEVLEDIEKARERVAQLIGADAEEIIFTSGGTESDNTALAAAANPLRPGLVTSAVEHPAVLETVQFLAEEGHPAKFSEVNRDGSLNLEMLQENISGTTGLVSIMMANNETGVIMSSKDAADAAHRAGAIFHTDAV